MKPENKKKNEVTTFHNPPAFAIISVNEYLLYSINYIY